MASKVIKGLTVEIGGDTTKLGKALASVEQKSRNLTSELGNINRLLKFNPTDTELLAQKHKVLTDAVGNTKKRLDMLREAEKQVQEQFKKGEVSEEQVRALKREVIEAESKFNAYKNAAKETKEQIKALGDNSEDAAQEVDELGDSSAEAKKHTDDLGESAGGTLSDGLKLAIGFATAAAAAIVGIVESTQEYRTAMGKLDTAFTTANHSSEVATETYKEMQSILGETDQAVEASNHLAQLCDTEEELVDWIEIATGVYATFGDSLPIEGLTEAANETAKVGQVTGPLADALNWAAKEGDTFGVSLKENIKFTEKSKKELDAMTDAQRAEYEATKDQYDAIEDYNKSIEEAAGAEDLFNIALENCSDEQERQQLITKTLTKYYGKAAKAYKDTNKEVIEANKANEEWNSTMAELGEEMQPAVTEIKNLGTSLLKEAKEPLKDVAGFITDKFIPAVLGIVDWARNNGPVIKGAITGITTAWVAYKAATVAATVAENGLKGAIMATTAAQTALNLVQSATPWGLAAVAITGVVTALAVFATETVAATDKVEVLTEEERELMEAANEAAEAFREQQQATSEQEGKITSHMGHVKDLAGELQTLADKSGKVKDADKARVDFILNELNSALGTEYSMVGDVIQNYDDLQDSIYEVIEAKTANALLEANNADYLSAMEESKKSLEALTLSEKDYAQAKKDYADFYPEYVMKTQELENQLSEAQESGSTRRQETLKLELSALETAKSMHLKIIDEKKKAYDQDAVDYGNYAQTIMDYEDAQTAVLQGNYDRAVDILTDKGTSFFEYSDDVDAATREAIDSLYEEAINAGLEAERTKRNFEQGIDGYTEEMVKEAEKGYEDALDEWATAYADAQGVGNDLGSGLGSGMESNRYGLISKARSIVQSIIGAFRSEADSHSPSRKMIAFGEDMGEGGAIGLENKTKRMLKVAEHQVDSLMGTYSAATGSSGQGVFSSVRRYNSATRSQTLNELPASIVERLTLILNAIKAGQVLTIDGKTWVGATVDRTDSALGQRRELVARGAL